MREFDLTSKAPLPSQEYKAPRKSNPFIFPITFFVGIALIAFLLLSFSGCPNPGPSPNPIDPDIEIEGLHIMILEDTGNHDTLSAPRQGIFTSPEIVEWCDENCAKYEGWTAFLKADVEDDLSEMPEIMVEMQSQMKKKMSEDSISVPIIGALNPTGFEVDILPEDKDRTLQYLESLK